MAKVFKAVDEKLYLDVTEQAQILFPQVPLFAVWQKGETIYRLPITTGIELHFALDNDKSVCLEVADARLIRRLYGSPKLKFEDADFITHNGFLYVKYNDLFN